jgi:predicted choloylglycine hydrolase
MPVTEHNLSERVGTAKIILAGSPRDIGMAHGAALSVEISEIIDSFLRPSAQVFETPYDEIRRRIKGFEQHIDPEYIEEMQTIASAARVDYEDILAINTFFDTDSIMTYQSTTCINLVAFGPATESGRLIHGRNLDFPSTQACQNGARVFEYHPRTGNSFLAAGWAGMAGVFTAINSAGLTVTEVGAWDRDVSWEGTPLVFLLRKIMQYADTIEDAFEIVRMTPKTAGFNLTLTDYRVPEAIAIEISAKAAARRRSRKSLLVVSDNRMAASMPSDGLAPPSAVSRYIRMYDLAEQHYGRIDVATMRNILADRFDLLLRRQTLTYNSICNSGTLQSVVFEPDELAMWVSQWSVPAPDGVFVRYALDPALDAAEATIARRSYLPNRLCA